MGRIPVHSMNLLASVVEDGRTYKEVAADLGVSRSTVERRIKGLLRRLHQSQALGSMRADYLDSLPAGIHPRHGAVAIANPIEGDWVRMTNRDWAFSIQEAQRQLDLTTLLVVNNFTALAMSLPRVGADGRHQVGGGEAQANGVIGLIGPGTGLGVSSLIPSGDRWVTLASEGGHVGFAPSDERELRILQFAWKTMPRVSAERLLSGPGLELIYQALTHDQPGAELHLSAAEIVRRALQNADSACSETVECFCAMLGTMASDLALTLGATGGIFVGGGIVPRLGELFDRSPFRQRFEEKGRFSNYVARIPTYVLTAENPAFHGVSSLLADHVPDQEGGNPLLERVRGARESLSPAERRVATATTRMLLPLALCIDDHGRHRGCGAAHRLQRREQDVMEEVVGRIAHRDEGFDVKPCDETAANEANAKFFHKTIRAVGKTRVSPFKFEVYGMI